MYFAMPSADLWRARLRGSSSRALTPFTDVFTACFELALTSQLPTDLRA